MFEFGDIVYHRELFFSDNCKDVKKGRPCIVLFSTTINNEEFVCSCPLTTNKNSFNRFSEKYTLISETVYNYRKLCFAKLLDVSFVPVDKTCHTGITLSRTETKRVLNLIIEKLDEKDLNKDRLKQYLIYLDLFLELEERDKKNKKLILK